jgi:putative ABC transport system substrate-binding protein
MPYGLNVNHQCERTAAYIHRIFKGARPANLPVEQPTPFELNINHKTANALGLAMPLPLLISADNVFE